MPALAELEEDALAKLGKNAQLIEAPAGAVLFQPGSICENYLIVLQGTVRTSITSENGREIVLYRVETGQTCVLTTSCLLASSKYDTEGIAETDVVALAIPRPMFIELLGTSEKFRQLAFDTFSDRLHDLIVLINEISFGHLDTRLANYLVSKAVNNEVVATHQTIATDLGSAREAVSRLLKEFERKGFVELDRGRIVITGQSQLHNYSKK
ncbi:MAG TPA: Crp/Fnr family transcriptional regulator [Rhizobiales bacterium]|nr:Crp/Fnr family transcriptional regulator [Hyphomicrobiales bacterium]